MLGVDDLELAIRTSFSVLTRGMVTAASGSEEPFTLERSFGKCNPPPLSYCTICFSAKNLSPAAIYLPFLEEKKKKKNFANFSWYPRTHFCKTDFFFGFSLSSIASIM